MSKSDQIPGKPVADLKETPGVRKFSWTQRDELLDSEMSKLHQCEDPVAAMHDFFEVVNELRATAPTHAVWLQFCEHTRAHPLFDMLRRSELAAWVESKPWGFSGDPICLDMCCYKVKPCKAATPIAHAFNEVFIGMPEARAVAAMSKIVGEWLDTICMTQRPPVGAPRRALSVGCGFGRELGHSSAFAKGLLEVVGIDQDERSLAGIQAYYPGVQVVHNTVRAVVDGKVPLGVFDGVWACGLYDYLNQQTAIKFTAALWECVKPGGRLIIANYHEHGTAKGILDIFGWVLVYRGWSEMMELVAPLGNVEMTMQRRDCFGQFLILDIKKRSASTCAQGIKL